MRVFAPKKRADDLVAQEEETQISDSSAVDESELELTHVGPYEIVAPVGKGGMGTVYKAIDRKRDKTVAVKVLDRRYDVDKKRRKRDYLGREILLAADLKHECIVRMHKELLEEEDRDGHVRRCLIMEFVDGHNLRKHITERDLSFSQMVGVCIRLAQGIDFLHQNGVVHRDIKPENFLFTRDLQQAKIVDFGLSKTITGWRGRWFKEQGGTPRYMSPEQLSKHKLDARSDIFSYGITMYELFTGTHPCNGKDSLEIRRQIRDPRYKFEAPSKRNAEIPPKLDRIILKALRRQPERRYQSMTELLLDLTRLGESKI